MAISRTTRNSVLLALLAALAWFKFAYEPAYEPSGEPYDSMPRIVPTEEEIARRELERGRAVPAPRPRAPAPDLATIHGIEMKPHYAARSAWGLRESELASQVLSRTDASVLVLPVQVDKNGFDPIERSLIMRYVAAAIENSTSRTIANPSAVFRYLGRNNTSFSAEAIAEVSRLTGAKIVLELRASHDRQGLWRLEAAKWNPQSEDERVVRTWSKLKFSSVRPPSSSLDEFMDEIVRFATGSEFEQVRETYRFDPAGFQFPGDIDGLLRRSGKSPLHSAAYLQMLAMMHPSGAYNEYRNELFERSLVELRLVSQDSPFYSYFVSRALAYLGRRPAAVAALGQSTNEDEIALLAALNGNLPELRKRLEDSSTSILDFMALRDLQFVERQYDQVMEREVEQQLVNETPQWAPFLARAMADHAVWSRYSVAEIKAGLEDLIPPNDGGLAGEFAALAASRGFVDDLNVTRSLWKHIDEFLARDEVQRVRADYANSPTASDVVELARAIGTADHIREIEEDLYIRALPESALAEISKYSSIFAGHPEVELLRGKALFEQATESSGSEKQNLDLAAADAMINGLAWTGSMSRYAVDVARAFGSVLESGSPNVTGIPKASVFERYSRRYFEWPRGTEWFLHVPANEMTQDTFLDCIDYTWTQFHCVEWHAKRLGGRAGESAGERTALLESVAHRFSGHPRKREFEVRQDLSSGSTDSEEQALLSLIDQESPDWRLFYALGRIQFRKGDYSTAAETWLSYPGFTTASRDAVLSNSARSNLAGSNLYWIGQYEQATPLLELAAATRDGSGSQMQAAQRLALIYGDLDAAEYWAANRVRRYESLYAQRDLLEILHVRGESAIAWEFFEQLQQGEQNPEIWSGALVGHRIEAATIEEMADWVMSSASRHNAESRSVDRHNTAYLAPRYVMLAGTMDRGPTASLSELVRQAYPLRENAASRERYLRDHLYVDQESREKMFANNEHEYPKRRYERMAAAMTSFLEANYAESFEQFSEASWFFPTEEYLPYMVFAAAASGRAGHFRDALAKREVLLEKLRQSETMLESKRGYRFDEDLAYAVLAGFDGDHKAAIEFLVAALSNRPYLEDRAIYPMYEIVDLADRLYERTGFRGYRDFALDLSRRHTVILPMHAWAYFVVAEYSEAQAERIKATASGLHLDPLSERGSKLPKDVLDAADELLEKSGPPFLHRTEKDLPQST